MSNYVKTMFPQASISTRSDTAVTKPAVFHSETKRKMQLEKKMIGLPEEQKKVLRQDLEYEEVQVSKESRKKVTTADFESLQYYV